MCASETTWSALLEDHARIQATETAVAMAAALQSAPPRAGTRDALPTLQGTLGAVLFFTALGETTGDSTYLDAARGLLDEAIDRASDQDRPSMSLYGVPVGVGWAAAVVQARLGALPEDETDLDVFVSNVVAQETWPWPLDILHGLAGLGAYCLTRLPQARARRDLERIVRHLAATAEQDRDGLYWPYVPAPGGPFTFNEHRPQGHVNLGLAHGMPGIVAFLAGATTAGVPGASDVLAPAVAWLTAQRLPPGSVSSFPRFVLPDGRAIGSRLAWCYGDPGVAVALLSAGHALGERHVVDLAHDVAIGCAGQPSDDVGDATLCHGSAGLGHMFNRLGHAFGDERLLDLARHWFGVTLTRDRAGLTVVDREQVESLARAGAPTAVDAGYGLLLGAAGVGLALTAAITDGEPWWDAVLFAQPQWP